VKRPTALAAEGAVVRVLALAVRTDCHFVL
jgi:hypothetical protein